MSDPLANHPAHAAAIDWAHVALPDAWPDQLNWHHPATVFRLLWLMLRRSRRRVQLPAGLVGAQSLPKYLLQEFHNLPNGNYSKHICRGYARNFDRVMLGTMRAGRARVAQALRGSRHALDLGCGGGGMAAALVAEGITSVMGLDPSPYLLQYAAQTHAGVAWRQATAENTGLADKSLDGVAVCFVLHEIPPRYLRQVVAELARIVRPGGRLAVLEPSPVQMQLPWWRLWRQYGWRGLYFRVLAWHVFEPFVAAWHAVDFAGLLAEHGFRVEVDDVGCPFRYVLAVRSPSA